ncbi:MAG: zinc metalloprotease ZmpA, partial [Streptomyces sp.]|nr:zinc metalloprotease ZmpA [Streptomyces sp.]
MQFSMRRATTALTVAIGVTALTTALLTPSAASADGRSLPSRATAVSHADAAIAHHAGRLAVTPAQGRTVRDVVTDTDGAQHVRY